MISQEIAFILSDVDQKTRMSSGNFKGATDVRLITSKVVQRAYFSVKLKTKDVLSRLSIYELVPWTLF